MKYTTLSSLIIAGILALSLAACRPVSPGSPGGLQVEEHALAAAPEPETLTFQPVEGTQDELLARHASQRAIVFSKTITDVDGNPALPALGETSDLVAVMLTPDPPQQIVEVRRGKEVIFTADAGLPSPLLPLQGLWTYDGHWALEILYAGESAWAGQVFIDGDLINSSKGYDEAFGFQLLGGEPFFFYQRDDHAGYSYAGEEKDLDYLEIPHYRCCGESGLNPLQAQDMVAFFARRDEGWFYVELGNFE